MQNGQKKVRLVVPACLTILSLNEINYSAFGEYSVEYHNELFGYLQAISITENPDNSKEDEFDFWLVGKGCVKTKQSKRPKSNGNISQKLETIELYIRNFIHHPENTLNQKYTFEEMKASIEKMRDILLSLNMNQVNP